MKETALVLLLLSQHILFVRRLSITQYIFAASLSFSEVSRASCSSLGPRGWMAWYLAVTDDC